MTDKLTIAGEIDTNNNNGGDDYVGWLAFASYKFTDKVSTAFRVSGASKGPFGDETKFTVAPTYAIDANPALRAEFSSASADAGDYTFVGGQIVFKF